MDKIKEYETVNELYLDVPKMGLAQKLGCVKAGTLFLFIT